MGKKKTVAKKTKTAKVIQLPKPMTSEPTKADRHDAIYDRIIRDIEALQAASEMETPDGKASRARILWYALAGHLAETEVLDHLTAAAGYMATGGKKPTPEQLAWVVPMGEALNLFFEGASKRDFRLKNKLVKTLIDASKALDGEINGRHWGMAVTDLARIAYLAELFEDVA